MRLRSIRLRLLVIYGTVFLVGSGVLITASYLFVDHRLTRQGGPRTGDDRSDRLIDAAAEAGVTLDGFPQPGANAGRPAAQQNEQLAQVFEQIERDISNETLNELLTQSLIALAIVAVLALFVTWLVTTRALRPIDAMIESVNRISSSGMSERVATGGPDDELQRLGTTFNELLDEVESTFNATRSFAADASHEIRTPLAIMRAEADNATTDPGANDTSDRLAAAVLAQLDRTERLLDSFLALAKIDSGIVAGEPVALDTLVGDVVGGLTDTADARNVRIDLALSPAGVIGDVALLERMIANAVQNAVMHNIEGGFVDIDVREDDGAVVTIANSGPSVSEDDIHKMFDRFERLQDGRLERADGHGLGMAIIRGIAEAHRGSISIAGRDEGGISLVLRLPAVSTST